MKTERELFEKKYKELTGCDDFSLSKKKDGDYKFDGAYFGWLMWQASANRDGYKLIPVEPTQEMLEALESAHVPDYEGGMYYAEQGYKAMLGATP